MHENKKLVVIIEDLPDWRTTIAREVKKLGHEVQLFSDFNTTLEFIENNSFDLAIIDQRLIEYDEEDTSGLELAKRVKARNRHVPVFILTGYGTLATVNEAKRVDETGYRLTDRYIQKDDEWLENLLKAIKEVLP